MRGVFVVLVLGLLACKSSSRTEGAQASEPTAASTSTTAPGTVNVKTRKPDVIVTIGELLKDYSGNELAADKKYKDKLIGVTGYVDQIKKDITNDAYVTLGTGKQFEIPQAQLYFEDGAEGVLSTLSKGQTVAAICRCEGLMMNVLLKDCALALNKDGGLIGSPPK